MIFDDEVKRSHLRCMAIPQFHTQNKRIKSNNHYSMICTLKRNICIKSNHSFRNILFCLLFFFNIFILNFCVILFNSFFGFHFDKLQCNDSNGCLWYLHLANFLATYRLDFLTVCLCTFTVCIWWQSNEEYIFWCIFSLNYSPVIP